jgi:hypothetical protein
MGSITSLQEVRSCVILTIFERKNLVFVMLHMWDLFRKLLDCAGGL